MDKFAGDAHDVADTESGLADVTRMRLAELLQSENTVLAHSLRQLIADLDRQQEIIAAFDNFGG
jgi:FXSXX-COOH protein